MNWDDVRYLEAIERLGSVVAITGEFIDRAPALSQRASPTSS